MNLQVLRPSRKPPRAGDIFVVRLPDGRYFHGLVVDDTASIFAGTPSDLLAVVFFATGTQEKLPVPDLSAASLVISPRITNRLPWSRGYFETVAHQPDVPVPAHSFEDAPGRFVDAAGRPLDGPRGTVALRALASFKTIDAALSKALGIPPAPDTDSSAKR
jgi:hypothetical protein